MGTIYLRNSDIQPQLKSRPFVSGGATETLTAKPKAAMQPIFMMFRRMLIACSPCLRGEEAGE